LDAAQPASANELMVAAASDLAAVQPALSKAFRLAPVRFVLGSSGLLARQIENGAPFDIYLSANEAFVHDLEEHGHVRPGSVREYAIGRLALWSRDNRFRDFSGLKTATYIAIANPTHAPYGLAAKQALEALALWEKLRPRIVYGENIRQSLQFAETGNADAALVAWSLVFNRGGILVAPELHAPIRQMGGVVARSNKAQAAAAFLEFLVAGEGRAILDNNGFFPPVRSTRSRPGAEEAAPQPSR
jgi:molybdate transport system substrate-binding protein